MRKVLLLSVLVFHVTLSGSAAAGLVKGDELVIRRAAEYPAHQDFQNLVIGADCGNTLEKSQAFFDTDKMLERGFMPVLVVIENNNTFPVQVFSEEIYLLDPDGTRIAPVPFMDVLLAVSLKKPLTEYSSKTNLDKIIKKDLMQDFERKAFGEKLIPPGAADHGFVFYPLPDHGNIAGYHLYLPEVVNFSDNEPLIFFEFELQ